MSHKPRARVPWLRDNIGLYSLCVRWIVGILGAGLMLISYPSPAEAQDPSVESLRSKPRASWDRRDREFYLAHFDEVLGRRNVIEAGGSPRVLERGSPFAEFAEGTAGSLALERFVSEQRVAGLLVLHEGRIRLERYHLGHSVEGLWTSQSVGKSVTSTLVGVALREGHIGSLEDPVTAYLDGLKGSPYEQVTIRQLLTMTSGVRWTEDYTDQQSDWARSNRTEPAQGMSRTATYMRTLEREAEPGEKWVYKTGETHLLGDLVRAATGKSLADYLSEKIWRPYGMQTNATWVLDPSRSELAGCCIQATLRDFARFGQFVLEDGRIDGVSVVPSNWFADATKSHVQFDLSGRGYGYQWWTWGNGTFSAIGINGQFIYVNPARQLVVVISSAWPEALSQSRAAARTEFILSVLAALAAESRGVGPNPDG